MIICIEYWKGDAFLTGQKISAFELKQQLNQVERIYDKYEDNFILLLCRMYGWECVDVSEDVLPDFTYDRDTGLLF